MPKSDLFFDLTNKETVNSQKKFIIRSFLKSHPLCATLYTVDPSLPLIDILAENDTEQSPNIFRFSQNIKILNPSFA